MCISDVCVYLDVCVCVYVSDVCVSLICVCVSDVCVSLMYVCVCVYL